MVAAVAAAASRDVFVRDNCFSEGLSCRSARQTKPMDVVGWLQCTAGVACSAVRVGRKQEDKMTQAYADLSHNWMLEPSKEAGAERLDRLTHTATGIMRWI